MVEVNKIIKKISKDLKNLKFFGRITIFTLNFFKDFEH